VTNSLVLGNAGGDTGGNVSPTTGSVLGLPTGFTLGQVVRVGSDGQVLLADNGGPTRTVALVAGSPAYNAGLDTTQPPTNLTTDQRGTGFARRVNGAVDVGAYEVQALPATATAAAPAAGFYPAGTALAFTLTYDAPVAVTGTPRLAVTVGEAAAGFAPLTGQSQDGRTLTFTYTVGQTANGAVAVTSPLDLNGGSLTNGNGEVAAGRTFTPPDSSAVIADTTAPTATAVSRFDPAGPRTNALEVTFVVTFGEPVRGVTAANFALVGTGTTFGAGIRTPTPNGPPAADGTIASWRVPVATGGGRLARAEPGVRQLARPVRPDPGRGRQPAVAAGGGRRPGVHHRPHGPGGVSHHP
jgi:hypothetical protein